MTRNRLKYRHIVHRWINNRKTYPTSPKNCGSGNPVSSYDHLSDIYVLLWNRISLICLKTMSRSIIRPIFGQVIEISIQRVQMIEDLATLFQVITIWVKFMHFLEAGSHLSVLKLCPDPSSDPSLDRYSKDLSKKSKILKIWQPCFK